MSEPAKPSKLGIVALVFAALGLCFFPFALVGLLLGILALTRKGEIAGGKGVGIAAVVGAPVALIVGLGIQAAIAIPAFVKYARESRTSEATTNVGAISQGVVAYYATERMDRSPLGAAVTQSLPPSLPRTPAVPGPDRQTWPADAAPGWRDLGFMPMDPLYYAYEYTVASDGRSFAVRAIGDLDGDGTFGVFERTGRVVGAEVQLDPLRIENETE